MINLPSYKKVVSTILSCIENTPPTVSFQYINTIANKVFNHKKVILSEINFDTGSGEIVSSCTSSPYGPAGHEITGNLRIVEDRRIIQELLIKGSGNKLNRIDAVCAYKMQWAKREQFDIRIFDEWHSTIDELIVNNINVLKHKKQSRKKQQVP